MMLSKSDPSENQHNAAHAECVRFLEQLRPGGPWVLTAIIPDGKTTTITARTPDEARKFIGNHDGKRNIYYSVNPTKKMMTSKAAKTDIAAIEYLLSDLDPKPDETAEAAKARYEAALDVVKPAPTGIVDSGNGIQALWKLSTPINLRDLPPPVIDPKSHKLVLSEQAQVVVNDVEGRVKLLMETLGSIAGTQNIDRILRLPFTINLPNAEKLSHGRIARPTKLIRFNGATCKLEEFRTPAASEPASDENQTKDANDFALLFNLLPPDLLTLIGDGVPVGEDRSAKFHHVVKRLKELGWSLDNIIALLGKYPGGIVKKYGRKFAEEVRRSYGKPDATAANTANAVQRVLDPTDPMQSARALMNETYTDPDGLRKLHRHRGAFWQWTSSYYREADDETIRSVFWTFLENSFRRTKPKDGPWQNVPFKPNRGRVGDAIDALNAVSQLDKYIEPPAWLTTTDLPPPIEFLACANGLLHLPSGDMYPPTPDYFNISATGATFDPDAASPVLWLALLDQIFAEDNEAKELLQDWFGYLLSPDTSQQKILLMVGPKRSGKGTIGRVLTAMLGRDGVGGPTMSSLSEPFGLEPLITKPLAIISDARIGARTDKSAIVERLLSISGEDTLTVPRKHKTAWDGKLPTRFIILTNELPSLSDGSGALAGRFTILIMTKSFFGKEDPALTNKLLAELPGILNWSIEGYRRLRERGYFIQPQSSHEAADDIEMLAAPVRAFVRDRCDVGPGLKIKLDDLWHEYRLWSEDEGRPDAGSKNWFARNLRSAVPGLTTQKPLVGGEQVQTYVGITLRPRPGV